MADTAQVHTVDIDVDVEASASASAEAARRKERVRENILASLRAYPGLTVTMLTPRCRYIDINWRHTLEEMIEAGEVVREAVPSPSNPARTIFAHYAPSESE